MGKKYDRLSNYAKVKGLTLAKISRAVGISSGLLSKGAKENSDISDGVCLKVSDFFTDLNKKWLLTGSGEMLVNFAPAPAQTAIDGINATNATVQFHDLNSTAALQKLTEEIAEQRKMYVSMLEKKDAELARRDEQINRLLEIVAKK